MIAAVLGSLLFSYSAGKKVEKSKQQSGTIDAVVKARKVSNTKLSRDAAIRLLVEHDSK